MCYNKSTTKKQRASLTPTKAQGRAPHYDRPHQNTIRNLHYTTDRGGCQALRAERENTMERYNYREAMCEDIRDYIRDEINLEEYRGLRDELEEMLNDDLRVTDSVTGNASGSYFFSAWKAEEAITHNWDLLEEALWAFGDVDATPIKKGAEWCDVTIRRYLLNKCIKLVLDEFADELEPLDDEEE